MLMKRASSYQRYGSLPHELVPGGRVESSETDILDGLVIEMLWGS